MPRPARRPIDTGGIGVETAGQAGRAGRAGQVVISRRRHRLGASALGPTANGILTAEAPRRAESFSRAATARLPRCRHSPLDVADRVED